MAAPVFIAATAGIDLNIGIATSVSPPAGTAVGDLLFAMILTAVGSNGSVTYPAGWTVVRANTPNGFRQSLAVAAFVHDGSASYSFTSVNRYSQIYLLSYRGDGSTPTITSSAIVLGSGSSINTTSISVASADSTEIVFAHNVEGVSTVITPAAGMTQRLNASASGKSVNVADAAVTPSVTPVRTVTQAATNQISVINVVIGTAGSGTTPIAFTGTIPNQTATVGVPFSLDVASYFTGTQTPFSYALATGDLTGTGLSRSGSVISGTPTSAGDIAGLSMSGTDADLNVATSNTFTITVADAGSPPAGTFTVGTITTTQTTASVPYTYSLSDQTGIQYRINGGSAVTASASPQALTGLTAGTTYGIEFRAVNSFGNGSWSTSAPFTTAAVPTGTITSEDLSRNNGAAPGVVSLTHIDVRLQSTGALVVRKTGVSTNSSSIFSFSDAAITTGSTYIVSWLESGGQFGIAYNVVAS